VVLLRNKEFKALQNKLDSLSRIAYATSVVNNVNYQYPTWSKVNPLDVYCSNADFYSIIKYIAESVSLIPRFLYYQKKDQQKAIKEIKALTSGTYFNSGKILSLRILQIKALEDADENDEVSKLLAQPNPYQDESEFEETLATYYLACGEFFIWKNKYDAGANEGKPFELYALNPNNVKVIVSGYFPQTITRYEYRLNGQKVLDAPPEDIIHVKTINPENPFRGLPPLKVGNKVVNLSENTNDRINAQVSNGNLPGVIFDKAIPYEESAQNVLDTKRKHLFDFLNNPTNAGVPYYSAGELGFLATGLKLTDLEALELDDVTFGKACNLYKINARLFNRKGDASYNNQQQDAKNAVLKCFLPLKYKIRNGLNTGLLPDFPDNDKLRRFVEVDVSNIPELQEDVEKMVNAVAALPVSPTGNEQRALLKYDAREEPWMDQPMIKAGYSFYDEVNIPPVDPNLLNTGT
jgi:phage portal protein BeeE